MTTTETTTNAMRPAKSKVDARSWSNHRQARPTPQTNDESPADQLAESQKSCDNHCRGALGSDSIANHADSENQRAIVGDGPTSTTSQNHGDNQRTPAGRGQTAESHAPLDNQASCALGPILADPLLGNFAAAVDDLEKVRCANENRLRTLTDTSERGYGLTLGHPSVNVLAGIVAALLCDSTVLKDIEWEKPKKQRGETCCLEHAAIKQLESVMRAHPLWPWAKPIKGLGEKQFARLLAAIGDPYWMMRYKKIDGEWVLTDNRPRTPSELLSYCGYGDAKHQVRRRGVKSQWNADARKRCHLISTSMIKESGRTWPMPPGTPPADREYRRIYEATRDQYAESVHTEPCLRCGPKGNPKPVGSPLSLGHQNGRGLRGVSKNFLNNLWAEAKRIHDTKAEDHV